MNITWLIAVVPLLCMCSANIEHFRTVNKRDIKTNPFLQRNKIFYPNNPFLSSIKSDEIRRKEILSTNPFFKNKTQTYSINIRNKGDSAEIECGVSAKIQHLIVDGDDFEEGTYPWIAALFSVKGDGLHFICGGTIISAKHVLTAAHCVVQNNVIVNSRDRAVALGKFDLQNLVISDPSVYKVKIVHLHPEYQSKSADADIAVLELQRKIKFDEFVRPACLWTGNNDLNKIVGQLGTVAGWGKTENGTTSLNRPKETKLPVVTQEDCLRKNPQFAPITSERTFCAGFKNGAGPCSGDSGSGLVIERNGQYVVRGVVSMSMNSNSVLSGCDLKYYVVFTDASKFLPWVDQILKN